MLRRVLVVEDDQQNAYLMRFILEKRGYEVLVISDGESAVASMADFLPDLVLMDMFLPSMDGQEATAHIKRMPEGRDVPVVAVTAFSMKGDRERILEAGCDGYMSKPIDPDTFVDEMERFIARWQDDRERGGAS